MIVIQIGLLLLGYFFSLALSFMAGYKLCKRLLFSSYRDADKKEYPERKIEEKKKLNRDDYSPPIEGDGVGIVYRPTAEELNKMHEDEATKQAKEAVAETLRQAEEPQI